MEIEPIYNYIKQNEGSKDTVYKDSLGINTIVIGFNLERKSAKEQIEVVAIDYEELVKGKIKLNDEQIKALFEEDVKKAIDESRNLAPKFEVVSNSRKLVLIDLVFYNGTKKLRTRFAKFLNAYKKNMWQEAARHLQDSLYYFQVKDRARRNVEALMVGDMSDYHKSSNFYNYVEGFKLKSVIKLGTSPKSSLFLDQDFYSSSSLSTILPHFSGKGIYVFSFIQKFKYLLEINKCMHCLNASPHCFIYTRNESIKPNKYRKLNNKL
ncbi:MAG: hypothetical protein ABI844_07195 [Saprospiraceae bacterium]